MLILKSPILVQAYALQIRSSINNYKSVPLDRPPVEGNPCLAGDLINIQ